MTDARHGGHCGGAFHHHHESSFPWHTAKPPFLLTFLAVNIFFSAFIQHAADSSRTTARRQTAYSTRDLRAEANGRNSDQAAGPHPTRPQQGWTSSHTAEREKGIPLVFMSSSSWSLLTCLISRSTTQEWKRPFWNPRMLSVISRWLQCMVYRNRGYQSNPKYVVRVTVPSVLWPAEQQPAQRRHSPAHEQPRRRRYQIPSLQFVRLQVGGCSERRAEL